MTELAALAALQTQIHDSRHRGERLLRGFWQIIICAGFMGFMWFFLFRLTHPSSGVDNLPFYVIGGFGALVIAVLMAGDIVFFNKTYDWERELEQRQSRLAAERLGLAPERVTLRFATVKHGYSLIVARENEAFAGDRIRLETYNTSLAFQLEAEKIEDAIAIVTDHQSKIRALLAS